MGDNKIIVKAAVMYSNGEVLEGRDYGHISNVAHKLSYPEGERIAGFVTHTGEFVLPDQAAKIAVAAKQLSEPLDKITPDNLWPIMDLE